MQESAAKDLLAKTFSQPFDKDRYRKFTKELLKDFEEKTFVYSGMTIPDAYRESISTLERIGKYVDKDGQKIDILIVRLCKETSLENARTRQRNFIAWYLEHSRKGNPKDAGLVAFVSPDAADWRFSLVKMEYNLVQADSGKVKAEKHLTPARRFSFLVGKTENTHTAQSRFLPLLLDDDKQPNLQDLGSAFSVEAITEEFFGRYRELFLELEETIGKIAKKDSVVRDEFESKGITTTDFAKKLLGQIVFLYFIQKKGWLGVERDAEWGTGPKDFLRQLFNQRIIKYKNFFNDTLEFLFYDMLAVDKGAACWHEKFNCRIPFLNGGLFEPIFDYDWKKTEIVIPNEVFSNKRDPNDLESGNGILDIFDRYNFTVKEDEPLEKEVAVDPELLGKVFENLLEVRDRKSKGSYYTPREVVHYMCQESLVSYLANGLANEVSREDISTFIKYGEFGVFNDARVEREGRETDTYFYKIPESVRSHAPEIDQLLREIKVCDPAVGSGAFPMGMINEIVRARWSLNPFLFDGKVEGIKGREFYDLKWHTIQESIYGVDIDPGAVEIAKLRLWLSLVVDEQNIEKIRPLPNLDFKIMQGNSLLEEFEGLKLFDEKLVKANADIDQQIEKLKTIRTALNLELKEVFTKSGSIPKDTELAKRSKANERQLAALVEKKKLMERQHQTGFSGFGNSAAEKLEHLKALQRQWFTASHKSDKERLKKELDALEWELIEVSLKEQGKPESLEKLKHYQRLNSKPYFLWQLNFSEVFNEKGGFDVVIANPPYLGERGNKEIFRVLRSGKIGCYYSRKMDLFYLFIHLSLDIGARTAVISFITTSYFLTADGAEILRTDMACRAKIVQLVNFHELKLFQSAQGQHNLVTLMTKDQSYDRPVKVIMSHRTGYVSHIIIQKMFAGSDSECKYLDVDQAAIFHGSAKLIHLPWTDAGDSSSGESELLSHISLGAEKLGDFAVINMGVQSGADFVGKALLRRALDKGFVDEKYLKRNAINEADGIYVIPPTTAATLPHQEAMTLLRPFVKNSDIRPFFVPSGGVHSYLYVDSSVDLRKYPVAFKYFSKFRPILRAREQVDDSDESWWWIRGSKRKFLEGTGEHILCPYRAHANFFARTNGNLLGAGDVYFITQFQSKLSSYVLTAILNSRLIFYWLWNRGKRKGSILELYQTPLSQIPIKTDMPPSTASFLETVVRKLEALSEEYSKGMPKEICKEVINLRLQLDNAIFEIYKLSSKEVQRILNSTKNFELLYMRRLSGMNEMAEDSAP